MTSNIPASTESVKHTPGALDGLKVLDASRLLPAALCTQMLADLGQRS